MRNAGMTRARQLITLAMFLLLLPAGLQAQADEEAWKRHMESASAALQANNLDDALFDLGNALREAEKFGPGDQRLANTLNLVAAFHRSQANFEEAESLYSRLITVLERGMGSDNPSVANALDTLATLHQEEYRLSQEEEAQQQSLQILQWQSEED